MSPDRFSKFNDTRLKPQLSKIQVFGYKKTAFP